MDRVGFSQNGPRRTAGHLLPWSLPVVLALLLATGCGPGPDHEPAPGAPDLARAPFTFANTDQFISRHLELELGVDFSRQRLEGSVIHHMECLEPGGETVVLDTRGLRIERVQLLGAPGTEGQLQFDLGATDPVRGEPLHIRLPVGLSCDGGFQLKIDYRTGPEASAIMWLPPDMTAGGEQPFMFTQSQSIHARSWIPLQDTPAVRLTYEAVIRTPPQLLAVMSANNDPRAPRNGEYRFLMPQPIPSYLLALAVGNLRFEAFGDRSGVYAEPEVLPAAAWEFADTQQMLDTAEAIYGAYRWGRYDLLILPPSFPYGGMENPRLSFITPSLLAGDRSLVATIAHELAHSWSGNLVSNRTWRDVWLNEGTTTYLEARLMEVLYGKDRADEERLLNYQSLLEDLRTVPPEMQPLAPVFESGDPDDGQQGLEYAKGQMLLEHLETLFGRDVFDRYLAAYFEHFAFQAISTEEFLGYIDRHLLQPNPGVYSREQLEEWLYQPGLPAAMTVPRSANLEAAAGAARAWASGELPVDKLSTTQWSPQAVIYFIKALPPDLTDDRLGELERKLGLSTGENAEIGRTWFTEVARRRHLPAYPAMRDYLGRFGRTRLIQPVYRELAANGEDLQLAREIFRGYRSRYHPLTVAAVEPLLAQPAPD